MYQGNSAGCTGFFDHGRGYHNHSASFFKHCLLYIIICIALPWKNCAVCRDIYCIQICYSESYGEFILSRKRNMCTQTVQSGRSSTEQQQTQISHSASKKHNHKDTKRWLRDGTAFSPALNVSHKREKGGTLSFDHSPPFTNISQNMIT